MCAISNRYLKPISAGDAEKDLDLGSKMLYLYLSKQVNTLQKRVELNKLDRRTVCWAENEDLTDLPCLDEKQLRSLTCGTYQ